MDSKVWPLIVYVAEPLKTYIELAFDRPDYSLIRTTLAAGCSMLFRNIPIFPVKSLCLPYCQETNFIASCYTYIFRFSNSDGEASPALMDKEEMTASGGFIYIDEEKRVFRSSQHRKSTH